MITDLGEYSTAEPMELIGKSTDDKPVDMYKGKKVTNGSLYYEMDTGNVYTYDGETKAWVQIPPN